MMLAAPDIGFDQYQMAAIYSSRPKGMPRKVGCTTAVSSRENGAAWGKAGNKKPGSARSGFVTLPRCGGGYPKRPVM
jgi:hypothetical protein